MAEIKMYYTSAQIGETVAVLAKKISADYAEQEVMLVCVLKGAVVFFADLLRALSIDPQIDFLQVSSYGMGTQSAGTLTFHKEISADISGRHLILVEDIIDTGFTLYHLQQYLLAKGAASCRICALLDKPSRRKVEIKADYTGLEVPDLFLVGYGLDMGEQYRSLPYIGVLQSE